MRVAYVDPFSGASGDMMLGALVDVGVSLPELQAGLQALPLTGYALSARGITQHGITGTQVSVDMLEAQPARDWAAIRDLLGQSSMQQPVKTTALRVFERLAAAEAAVHGTAIERVHFHEVGGVDAIVDICGTALGLHLLGIDALFSGPPRLGVGFVRAQHGLMPIPAPATAELLALAHAPADGALPSNEVANVELLTPTGAAILTTLARFERPIFASTTVGYGFGQRELPWPNALRLWIGDAVGGGAHGHTHEHEHAHGHDHPH